MWRFISRFNKATLLIDLSYFSEDNVSPILCNSLWMHMIKLILSTYLCCVSSSSSSSEFKRAPLCVSMGHFMCTFYVCAF